MELSKRNKFFILTAAFSLIQLVLFSLIKRSISEDTARLRNSRNGNHSHVLCMALNNSLFAFQQDTATTPHEHETPKVRLHVIRDMSKSELNTSLFENSAIGPNLKMILTQLYNDRGKLLPPEQFPTGVENNTAAHVLTENVDWHSTSNRLVNRTQCDAILTGNTTHIEDTGQTQSVSNVSAGLTLYCDFLGTDVMLETSQQTHYISQ